MPRIRTIKPQFWLDEKLGSISRDARLLYIGLWNLADDKGVFEYRPDRIKVQLFPYDTDITGANVQKWLDLLETTGDIMKFSEDGQNYGYIPTFLKHQPIKNPSQWRFTKSSPSVFYPSPTPVLPQQTLALPIGNREKESIKGIGNRESNKGKVQAPPKKSYGTFNNVFLTDDQYQKLVGQFGEPGAMERIERLSAGIASKGYKYKNFHAAILTWERRDQIDNNSGDDRKDFELPDGFLWPGCTIERGIEIAEGRHEANTRNTQRAKDELKRRGIPFQEKPCAVE